MELAVKICGLKRPEDVQAAVEFGANALGFVFDPRSPRFVGENAEIVKELTAQGPYHAKSVAVFGKYREGFDQFADLAQAHDYEVLPRARAVPVVRPVPDMTVEQLIERARRYNPVALAIDAVSPIASGGTGIRVDIDFALEVKELSPWPIVLAGGLKPENVAEAVRQVRPYAVDVSSGVESAPGVKDHELIERFVNEAKGA
ncbi:MAG: phosphoribosylanthranilate isomerase [Fimbriimonadaceae bacterium]